MQDLQNLYAACGFYLVFKCIYMMYIYNYILYMYIYIYIIYRERYRYTDIKICIYMYIYAFILYIYTYIYIGLFVSNISEIGIYSFSVSAFILAVLTFPKLKFYVFPSNIE